jgi:hypothetical protein
MERTDRDIERCSSPPGTRVEDATAALRERSDGLAAAANAVHEGGIEPPSLSAPEPKSSMKLQQAACTRISV